MLATPVDRIRARNTESDSWWPKSRIPERAGQLVVRCRLAGPPTAQAAIGHSGGDGLAASDRHRREAVGRVGNGESSTPTPPRQGLDRGGWLAAGLSAGAGPPAAAHACTRHVSHRRGFSFHRSSVGKMENRIAVRRRLHSGAVVILASRMSGCGRRSSTTNDPLACPPVRRAPSRRSYPLKPPRPPSG
jgi:hypothetical protein